jgi:hypothetical protein
MPVVTLLVSVGQRDLPQLLHGEGVRAVQLFRPLSFPETREHGIS